MAISSTPNPAIGGLSSIGDSAKRLATPVVRFVEAAHLPLSI
jgi:hypothetical protein